MANTEKKTEHGFDCLSVTSVQVYPFLNKIDKMLGVATVILNDQLTITGLRIMDGEENGLFVEYPPSTLKKDELSHLAAVFPIKEELREHIQKSVLEKYLYDVNTSVTFEVDLTHRDISSASLHLEIIAETETKAQEKAKEKAASIIPTAKDNGEWTIIKVVKHE